MGMNDQNKKEDVQITLTLLKEKAKEDTDLLTDLGYALEYGTICETDPAAAAKVYRLAAEAGSARAANNLGWLYEQGRGLKKDMEAAEGCFLLSADCGDPVAMINLGNLYEFGHLPSGTDYGKALDWYAKAGELGSDKGLNNYAGLLHYGNGTRQNYPLAFEIFRDLYSRKFSGTAFYMGLYYQNGFAVQQDYRKALQYYQEGAKQGDAYCYTQLGSMYGRGEGVDKDPKKALAYYRQAAGLGDSLAYVNIGWMYENGTGVRLDLDEARSWYVRGAAEGEKHAMDALARLEGWDIPQEEPETQAAVSEKEQRPVTARRKALSEEEKSFLQRAEEELNRDTCTWGQYLLCIRRYLILSPWHYAPEKAEHIIAEDLDFVRASYAKGETVEKAAVEIGYACG